MTAVIGDARAAKFSLLAHARVHGLTAPRNVARKSNISWQQATRFLTFDSQLLAQSLRATHVWIAALVEAQESMYIAGQADSYAFANATGRLRGNTQPKRAVGTQI